jgi:chromatin segregation and condensation protein Rec8/ScpA/Scc1 (kleisin family)
MQEVLTSLPKVEIKPVAKLKPTVSLEDMMDTLRTRIETHVLTKFSDIRAREPEHNNIIVGFLAILEIFKQGNIIITQADRFEDIHLELDKQGTPKYY